MVGEWFCSDDDGWSGSKCPVDLIFGECPGVLGGICIALCFEHEVHFSIGVSRRPPSLKKRPYWWDTPYFGFYFSGGEVGKFAVATMTASCVLFAAPTAVKIRET